MWRSSRMRNGWSRRQVLRGLGFSTLGMGLPEVLRRRTDAAPTGKPGRTRAVITIFLFGGPSHIDTWDMKPKTPVEYRGLFQPINTSVPGIELCEHLPQTARVMRHVALVRGMTIGGHGVGNGDHHADTYYVLTGNRPDRDFFISGTFRKPYPDDFPAISCTAAARLHHDPEIPPIVQCPALSGEVSGVINPGQFSGKLGPNWQPLMAHGVLEKPRDFQLPDLKLPDELDRARMDRRRQLLQQFDNAQAGGPRSNRPLNQYDAHYQRAYSLLTSDRTRKAFDIASEPEAVRARYGENINGQSLLMARRLVEAGVPSVAVHWVGKKVGAGLSWDTHSDNFGQLQDVLLPAFDASYSALLEDLDQRGLLDETLVVVNAEMGRTPKVGDPRTQRGKLLPGRDHWDHCMAALLAGGGVQGGQIYGASDKIAAYPVGKPVLPEDVAQTVYHALGIEDQMGHEEPDGRVIRLLNDGEALPLF